MGQEPAPREFGLDAVVERGLAELDRRGWDRCIVVGDEFGVVPATLVAAARPEAVQGLALGHACLSLNREGPRAAVNAEVMGAFESLMELDYRTFVRHLTQITKGAYDDEFAEHYLERVPHEVSIAYGSFEGPPLEPLLRELDVPLLLAKHDGCLAWKDEAFEDAVAAFPDAMRISTPEKPSVSAEFAQALREFCSSVSGRVDSGTSSRRLT